MYTTLLLAAALQDWERYSTHALAARDVAATLAKGAAQQLHVLSVYDYPPMETTDLPPELAVRQPHGWRPRLPPRGGTDPTLPRDAGLSWGGIREEQRHHRSRGTREAMLRV